MLNIITEVTNFNDDEIWQEYGMEPMDTRNNIVSDMYLRYDTMSDAINFLELIGRQSNEHGVKVVISLINSYYDMYSEGNEHLLHNIAESLGSVRLIRGFEIITNPTIIGTTDKDKLIKSQMQFVAYLPRESKNDDLEMGLLKRILRARETMVSYITWKLEDMKVPLRISHMLDLYNIPFYRIERKHIVQEMIDMGYVKTQNEAARRYLNYIEYDLKTVEADELLDNSNNLRLFMLYPHLQNAGMSPISNILGILVNPLEREGIPANKALGTISTKQAMEIARRNNKIIWPTYHETIPKSPNS